MSFFLQNWARLYSNMTPSEVALEPAIASLGQRYRVQHPFWGISSFADFVLLDDKVVIEVDGRSHNSNDQKAKDLRHTIYLEGKGWAVVRVTNDEVAESPQGALVLALKRVKGRPTVVQLERRLAQLVSDFPSLARPAKPARRSPTKKSSSSTRQPPGDRKK